MTDSKLVPLEYLPGYRMADDEPDIRGWDVVGVGGARVGRVADLLVDTAAAEVVAVLLTVPPADAGGEMRQATLPIERVRIDEESRVLVATGEGGAAGDRDAQAPAATSAAAPADAAVDMRVAGVADAPPAEAGRASEGGVESRSEGAAARTAEPGGDVTRVPVYEERLVVTRRPVVKEMLVIRKRLVQDTQVVEGDVRRERVDVERRDARGDVTGAGDVTGGAGEPPVARGE